MKILIPKIWFVIENAERIFFFCLRVYTMLIDKEFIL